MKKTINKESDVHSQICRYLKLRYPNAMYNTDLSGIKLTIGQAVKLKNLRSFRGFPDLVIYEPRKGMHGLFIELKRAGEKLTKKDGTFVSPHVEEQSNCMEELSKRGYECHFAIGIDEAMLIIDNYLER